MRYDRFAPLVFFWSSIGIAGVVQGQSELKLDSSQQTPGHSQNVLLVTLDGLRWQEVFRGVDSRLITTDAGVKDIDAIQRRFVAEGTSARREKLMPFLWNTVATGGVIYGDPEDGSRVVVSNREHFSYPGYSEILCGFADSKIDSNAKQYNENVTVLEWLNGQSPLAGHVASFCSWDVFPYIINDKRSGVLVNAGWVPVAETVAKGSRAELQQIDQLANEIPHLWPGVRYDYFTYLAAETYLRVQRPRVLYVSLGETDDWAHEGRYDLYLDAARRNDDYIRRLWETLQSIPEYRDKTTLIVTTDHGRGDNRDEWKSHSKSIAGCDAIWIAAMGPNIDAASPRAVEVTQSQVAATVAAVLGYDFKQSNSKVADRLPCVK